MAGATTLLGHSPGMEQPRGAAGRRPQRTSHPASSWAEAGRGPWRPGTPGPPAASHRGDGKCLHPSRGPGSPHSPGLEYSPRLPVGRNVGSNIKHPHVLQKSEGCPGWGEVPSLPLPWACRQCVQGRGGRTDATAPEQHPLGSQQPSLAHALSFCDDAGPAGTARVVGSLLSPLRPCWQQGSVCASVLGQLLPGAALSPGEGSPPGSSPELLF